MGALQGYSPAECYRRIEDNLWDTQLAQWSFWIPIQLVNFQFTPVRHQLNVVLVTSIVSCVNGLRGFWELYLICLFAGLDGTSFDVVPSGVESRRRKEELVFKIVG